MITRPEKGEVTCTCKGLMSAAYNQYREDVGELMGPMVYHP